MRMAGGGGVGAGGGGAGGGAGAGAEGAVSPGWDVGSPVPQAGDSAGQPLPFAVGDRIADRYDIKQVIGSGPHGVVLKVYDTEIEVDVALKMLDPGVVAGPEDQERVLAALRKARQVNHPNVVRLFDADVALGRVYYTMQYLEGLTLRRILQNRYEKRQVFTLLEAEPIVSQLCLALQHAHRVMPHGLVKPENVAVLPDVIKLMDFGLGAALAAPTLTSRALELGAGGELYFAPEVRAGGAVDVRADVFALGVTLGEMLSGERYHGDGEFDLLRLNPALPPAIAEVVQHAIAPDAGMRYAVAPDLAADLASVIDTGKVRSGRGDSGAVSTEAPPPSPGPSPLASESGATRRRERTEKTMEVSEDMIERPDGGLQIEPGEGLFDGSEGPTGPIQMKAVAEGSGSGVGQSTFQRVQMQASRGALGGPTEDFLGAAIAEVKAKPAASSSQPAMPATTVAAGAAGAAAAVTAAAAGGGAAGGAMQMVPVRQPDGTVIQVPLAALAAMAQQQRGGGGRGALIALVAVLAVLLVAVAGLGVFVAWPLLEERSKPRAVDGTRPSPRDDDRLAVGPKPSPKETAAPVTAAETAAESAAPAGTAGPSWADVVRSGTAGTAGAGTDKKGAGADDGAKKGTAAPVAGDKKGAGAADGGKKGAAAGADDGGKKGAAAAGADDGGKKGSADDGGKKGADDGGKKGAADESTDKGLVAATGTKCPAGMSLVKLKKGNYCIDRFEYPGGKGSIPKTAVDYDEAKDICEKDGKRLCSVSEWTSGCLGKGGAKFPYGDTYDPEKCITDDDEGDDRPVMAAGSFAMCKSAVGVYDMSGNVEEWVYGRVKMGGGGNKADALASCTNKAKGGATKYTGFRCCADPAAK
jgi:serine/threonine protein kinase